MLLCAVLFVLPCRLTVSADNVGSPVGIDNISKGDITYSYLETTNDGFMRVFYNNSKICLEYYDNDLVLKSKKQIPLELPIWGGFYKGNDAYYVVEGKNNTDCVDGTEVVRIIKYDTDWKKIGSGSVFAKSGWEYEIRTPFMGGRVSIAENNGVLFVATGREGYYDASVGMGHQGMMLIRMDEKSFDTKIVYGDFWHSFSQYIGIKGSDVYVYEQSEGSRCNTISRFDADKTDTDYFDAHLDHFGVFGYGGSRESVWAIPCYASVDDMAFTSKNILGIGTSIDQTKYDSIDDKTAHNIYLTITPFSDHDGSDTKIKWLTNYSGNSKSFIGLNLTKINDDRFLVTWEEQEYTGDETASDLNDTLSYNKLHYMFIDGLGNKLSKEFTAKAAISECHPVVKGKKIVYYASNSTCVDFYTINSDSGAFSKKVYRIAGKNVTWSVKDSVLTVSGSGDMDAAIDEIYHPSLSDIGWSSHYLARSPWEAIAPKIKKIVIKGTVTSIPKNGFTGFENLTEVVVSSGVKSIGDEAFSYSKTLEKLTLPASVKTIGKDIVWTGSYWIGDESHVYYATIYAPKGSAAEKYANKYSISFISTSKSIAKATVSGIKNKYYTGKAITQTPTVKLGSKTLKSGTDYTVSYKNNKAIGTATVTIKGKGAYTGTVKATFKICPKKTTLSRLTSPRTKQLKATYTKVSGVTGYKITYSTSSKFTKATTKSVNASGTSKTISKLTKGKTYYVKVRTYKTVNGTKYYSGYSEVKKIKVK